MPPAFLSKVFSRGKDKERDKDDLPSPTTKQSKRTSRASAHSLLEGKFEAVSPTISPSALKFDEKDKTLEVKEKEREKEKERTALFRPKSRTKSAGAGTVRRSEDVPQLTLDLNLPIVKSDSRKRDLDIVYEGVAVLDDAVLGEKRLSAAEALKLMRMCSSVITSRGLESLGVMHPHWHSASSVTQRKIISLFLSSLAAPSTGATVASPTSAASAFESELDYARSPHDIAAVFRWALRHLRLDGDAFGKDDVSSLAWYDGFAEQEKAKAYPQTAFSELLLPVVKPSHAELLDSTLSLASSLASHSERNGVSGSKLSMFLGHYLLTGNKVDGLEDWLSFYAQWERAGRALEHIFLANLRDEASKTRIPKRLSELITSYPYSKHAVDSHFPRPARFATRKYDALHVRITTQLAPGLKASREQRHPLRIIENALRAETGEELKDAEVAALWEEIKKLSLVTDGADPTSDTSLSSVLSDDTIRILSLKPDGPDEGTPTIAMFTHIPEHEALYGKQNGAAIGNGKAKTSNGSVSVSRKASDETREESSPITTDWTMFSSAGFGGPNISQSLAATLLDSDLEKTAPALAHGRSRSLRKSRSPARSPRLEPLSLPTSPAAEPIRFKTALVSLVKLDESFVDFWSDALLDPISLAWPAFVVCQLKSDVAPAHGDKKVTWLVVEQKFLPPSPPPAEEPSSHARRASSPRPSMRSESEGRPGVIGRVSSTFSASRKRFNFFGGPPATAPGDEGKEASKPTKGTKVNEIGEIISGESTFAKEDAAKRSSTGPATAAILPVVAGAAVATASDADEASSTAPEHKTEVSTTGKPVPQAEDVKARLPSLTEAEEASADAIAPPTALASPEAETVEMTSIPTAGSAIAVGASAEIPADVTQVNQADTASAAESVAAATPELDESQAAETEGATAGVHPGAGESRFVEHIETPPNEKKTGPELTPELETEHKQEAEPLMTVETVVEAVVPPVAGPASDSELKEVNPVVVEEPVLDEAADLVDDDSITSVVEEPVSASVEAPTTTVVEEQVPVIEESATAAVEESTVPAIEDPVAPTVEEFAPKGSPTYDVEDSVAPAAEEPLAPAEVDLSEEISIPASEENNGALADDVPVSAVDAPAEESTSAEEPEVKEEAVVEPVAPSQESVEPALEADPIQSISVDPLAAEGTSELHAQETTVPAEPDVEKDGEVAAELSSAGPIVASTTSAEEPPVEISQIESEAEEQTTPA